MCAYHVGTQRIHDDGDYDIPLKPAPDATPARKRKKGKGKEGEVQVKDDPDEVGERVDDGAYSLRRRCL